LSQKDKCVVADRSTAASSFQYPLPPYHYYYYYYPIKEGVRGDEKVLASLKGTQGQAQTE